MTDVELAVKFQQGDQDALAEVYRRHFEMVRDTIERYTKACFRSEIDDICQYFWTRICQDNILRNYDPERPLNRWLYILACQTPGYYYDLHTRAKGHLGGQNYIPVKDNDDVHGWLADYLSDPSQRPEKHAIIMEDFGSVLEAMKGLHEEIRKTLMAFYVDGRRADEFAQKEGIAEATVYTRLRRGIQQLRKALEVEA